MNKVVPIIQESADELKQLLARERDPAIHQRLHALYLLASGQARFRGDVARLLGVDRNTVGRWLERYAQGGVAALRARYIPPGKRKPLTPAQLAQLRQRLADPQGFASYADARRWIQDTFGVALTYNATHKLVHYQLGASPKVARPAHIKKR
jgi:transposase